MKGILLLSGIPPGSSLSLRSDVISVDPPCVAIHARHFLPNDGPGRTIVAYADLVHENAIPLGTVLSERRFKHDIKPMDKASEDILAHKTETIHYKEDANGTTRFGLIPET